MRVTIIVSIISLFVGTWAGWKLRPVPAPVVKDRVITQTQEKVITRVVREPGGVTSITKEVIRHKRSDAQKVLPEPLEPSRATRYRMNVLLPIGGPFAPLSVGIGRRLLGPLWLEAQYSIESKELTAGVSYEW